MIIRVPEPALPHLRPALRLAGHAGLAPASGQEEMDVPQYCGATWVSPPSVERIHDSRRGWHATRVSRYHEGEITIRLESGAAVEPRHRLDRGHRRRPSAEVRATLPLRWH